jgi:PPOX class probable F420-dependent enzyme
MLTDNARDLALGPNLATIATLLPSGRIQVHPTWVDTDGEHILVNTEIHRQKFKNVEADPRITVTILDFGNPWHWSEIRGRVVRIERGQKARDHIDHLARQYLGTEDYPNPIQSERAILVIEPERVFDRAPAG